MLATPGRFTDDHPVDHAQLVRLTPERGLFATSFKFYRETKVIAMFVSLSSDVGPFVCLCIGKDVRRRKIKTISLYQNLRVLILLRMASRPNAESELFVVENQVPADEGTSICLVQGLSACLVMPSRAPKSWRAVSLLFGSMINSPLVTSSTFMKAG